MSPYRAIYLPMQPSSIVEMPLICHAASPRPSDDLSIQPTMVDAYGHIVVPLHSQGEYFFMKIGL
jgi:hypothetical protein